MSQGFRPGFFNEEDKYVNSLFLHSMSDERLLVNYTLLFKKRSHFFIFFGFNFISFHVSY